MGLSVNLGLAQALNILQNLAMYLKGCTLSNAVVAGGFGA
jgi:hypothetical protein